MDGILLVSKFFNSIIYYPNLKNQNNTGSKYPPHRLPFWKMGIGTVTKILSPVPVLPIILQ